MTAESGGLLRPALSALVPYEPGKPAEEAQRELGLARVVKLASNEGPFGPFPAALEAIARTAAELNRYPDGGVYRLRSAIAELHDVRFEEVAVGSGADGVIDNLLQATLEPGDELVCGWPSFSSFVIYGLKLGATPVKVPLRDERYDLEALLAAVTPRTKLVCICNPNNPTGTMNTRAELDAYFEQVPEDVLTVLDQAYFEYVEEPDYPNGVGEYFRAGRRVLVLRTFSKIYGLAGLRVGYGIGPQDVVAGLGKTRRAFDVTSQAQQAALASLGSRGEIERRRRLNREGRAELERIMREHALEPAPGQVGNFLFARVGGESQELYEALLREGVIVRPTAGFGAPDAIRVTVGTPEEHAFFAAALGRVEAAILTS